MNHQTRPTPRGVDRISSRARKTIFALYESGLGTTRIAAEMGRRGFQISSMDRAGERAAVHAALVRTGNNVKRTARETGVPASTVRRWKEEFEANPSQLPREAARAANWTAQFVENILRSAGVWDPQRPRISEDPRETAAEQSESFWSLVDKHSSPIGCWLWTGRIDRRGYGRFGDTRAHRFAFESEHGPLGDTPLHHVCANRRCVNSAHLLPVEGPSAHARLEKLEKAFIAETRTLIEETALAAA